MRIYLASWYLDKPRMRNAATMLQNAGVRVVSSWIFSPGNVYPLDGETQKYWAVRDEVEVADCDVFVAFADADVFRKGQGGRHTEFGLARALGKKIVIVGEPEQVFHHLPGIKYVKTVADLLQYVEDVEYLAWLER